MAAKKPEVVSKSLFYLFDPDETYTYNVRHGTEYPYNKFPKGAEGQVYKPTRFINWQPIPEDVIIRYYGAQIIVNFQALFPDTDPMMQIFQLRSKRPEIQNLICEDVNEVS